VAVDAPGEDVGPVGGEGWGAGEEGRQVCAEQGDFAGGDGDVCVWEGVRGRCLGLLVSIWW
jgi:hypothetical protein